jgi:pimeloyl-ACP methyl ester carboxylesterase
VFEEAGIPDIVAAMQGQEFQAAYSLDDMADDAVGLLDALGIDKAHICGVSMGAMITQVIGYRHPSRVLSLIPIMGTTGNPALPRAKPEAMEMLIIPNPEEREAYIEYSVIMWKIFWGSLHFDEDIVRKRAAVSYDRAFCPQGIPRQHAAIISNGNRKSRLDPLYYCLLDSSYSYLTCLHPSVYREPFPRPSARKRCKPLWRSFGDRRAGAVSPPAGLVCTS